jgi:hypothetical protein
MLSTTITGSSRFSGLSLRPSCRSIASKIERTAEPIVDALSRQSPITFDTLLAAVSDGGFDEAFVTRIIKELARDGLVRVSSESETATAV